jgi:hypothetical protein
LSHDLNLLEDIVSLDGLWLLLEIRMEMIVPLPHHPHSVGKSSPEEIHYRMQLALHPAENASVASDG